MNKFYEFQVLPFGISYAPYLFTKIMRPIIKHFRSKGISCVAYIDDWILIHNSIPEADKNTMYVVETLQSLGFLVNFKKCCLRPQTSCLFLGFVYDTNNMIMKLPQEKCEKIINTITKLKNSSKCKIKFLAHLAGLLVSCCPAVKYGRLYTKSIEREKYLALKKCNGNYNKIVTISENRHELVGKSFT